MFFELALFLLAANWPSWRGPDGIGVSIDQSVPTHWSKTEGVSWRIALPEPGNSTPCAASDRLETRLDLL